MSSPRTTDEVKPLDAGKVAEEAARAAEVISRYLRPTPCRLSEHFSEQLGLEVYLKPENFQRTGSFKVRGAFYATSRLNPSQRQWGVVTASAGSSTTRTNPPFPRAAASAHAITSGSGVYPSGQPHTSSIPVCPAITASEMQQLLPSPR